MLNKCVAQNNSFRIGNDFSDSIDRIAFLIDHFQGDSIRDKLFALDSIDVQYKKRANKNLFKKSHSQLYIDLYFDDITLLKAEVTEISPLYIDLFSKSILYFDSNKVVYERYFEKIRPCMGVPLNKSIYEIWGYNPCLNSDFLKRYIPVLVKLVGRPVINLKGGIE